MVRAYVKYRSKQISLDKIKRLVELTEKDSFQLLVIYTHKKDYEAIEQIISKNFINVDTGSSRMMYIAGEARIQLEKIDYYV